jgi:hypothetical protein
MSKDITEAACNEDEGADGEGVSRRDPAYFSRLVVDVKGASDDVCGTMLRASPA